MSLSHFQILNQFNSRAISFRNEYTPFGESIENLSGNGSFDKQQERGYTGHRMIASANVINMNARIYDPAIARFTSPDTVVPDATMSMAHNRYIYVYNNPIKYVDPDGHCPFCWFIVGAIIFTIGATSDDSFIHSVGTVVGSLMMMYGAGVFNVSSAGVSMSTNGAVVVGGSFNVGFTTGYISSGGDMGEAFKSGMFSALGAAAAFNIGHVIPWEGSENVVMAKMALAHGVSQGIISELRGGEFKSGFIGGFLGKMTGGLAETMFDDKVAQYIAVTMIGGAVSEAAGGDFLDGAISAAMVHLFNDAKADDGNKLIQDWLTGEGPKIRLYGPDSQMTQELMTDPAVRWAKNDFITKHLPINDIKEYYAMKFGITDFLFANTNTLQNIGSYGLSIYKTGDNKLTFYITNSMSFNSFTAGLLPNISSGPMSTIETNFWWEEPIR